MAKLGALLREKRSREHLSIRQAAEAAGVSFSTLSRIESGSQPDLATFLRLCRWLEVEPGELFLKGPTRPGGTIQEVTRHLLADPALSTEAAEGILKIVRDLYEVLASKKPAAAMEPLAVHLRAASVMRPGVPERLSSLLADIRKELRTRASGSKL